MMTIHEEYLVDEQGQRKAVVVPIADWRRVLEALEELDDIGAYDRAKGYPSDPVPFEQAVLEVRDGRTD